MHCTGHPACHQSLPHLLEKKNSIHDFGFEIKFHLQLLNEVGPILLEIETTLYKLFCEIIAGALFNV